MKKAVVFNDECRYDFSKGRLKRKRKQSDLDHKQSAKDMVHGKLSVINAEDDRPTQPLDVVASR
tara:strand:- start:40 stop:231 length:192 start_codon:yes stop_codon:yes gene_type:complete